MTKWTAADIPDQSGRIAVVTGANSGLGLVTSRELARAGARVILTSRDRARGEGALRVIGEAVPGADVELRLLDLSSLASVQEFAEGLGSSYDAIDLLVNNAGVMAIPRQETVDGFERQFATNHLGHFALTGRLLPLLVARAGSRVVTVSSNAHRGGKIDFDDLQRQRSYGRWRTYSATKLANLLFTYELQRRLAAAGAATISVAAHPGTSSTNLTNVTAGGNPVKRVVLTLGVRVTGQSDEMGALPQLYAATMPDVQGGQFWGPDGRGGNKGYPTLVRSTDRSHDEVAARQLWQASVDLTGVGYDVLAA